jgi:hypothetical protein
LRRLGYKLKYADVFKLRSNMSPHSSQILRLREELAVEVKHFCHFTEMNIGILACDAAIIYKMISAARDLLEDLAFLCAY